MKPTNIVNDLIALIFEGHNIRIPTHEGKRIFVAKDIFNAAGIKATRDAYRRLKAYERVSTQLDTLGGRQTMICLTESGVYHVLFASQKPAAEKLRCYLAEEVMPQLMRTGRFTPGATEGERFAMEHSRLRSDRAEAKADGAAALDGSGLLTISAFRRLYDIADVLRFSAALQRQARRAGYAPERFFTGTRRHTPAWPLPLLTEALADFQTPVATTPDLFETFAQKEVQL